MTQPSSLQRAAAAASSSRREGATSSMAGQFEARFAGGLDLSEFADGAGNSAASTGRQQQPTTSYAAALLQQKQAEAAAKREQARQDARFQEALLVRRNEEEILKQQQDAKDERNNNNPALTPPAPASLSRPGATARSPQSNRGRAGGTCLISALVVGMHSAEQRSRDQPRMLRGGSNNRKISKTVLKRSMGVKGKASNNNPKKQQPAGKKHHNSKPVARKAKQTRSKH